jgi:hypothetical protein
MMQNQNLQAPTAQQQLAVFDPEEFRSFNHYYNIQLCIVNCINNAGNALNYVYAVEQFEATLLPDLNEKMEADLSKFTDEVAKKYGQSKMGDIEVQFEIARKKYRLLYGLMKGKSPTRAVLAIGSPKCKKCGEPVRWD